MIPSENIEDLMLRDDVIEAVADGKFHILPISSLEEGIEILTGVKAGRRDSKGGVRARHRLCARGPASPRNGHDPQGIRIVIILVSLKLKAHRLSRLQKNTSLCHSERNEAGGLDARTAWRRAPLKQNRVTRHAGFGATGRVRCPRLSASRDSRSLCLWSRRRRRFHRDAARP